MSKAIAVRTRDGWRRLQRENCFSWKQRYAESKAYACFLYLSNGDRWFIEKRYYKTKWRSHAYEVDPEEAADWLISQEQEMPPECELPNPMPDVDDDPPTKFRVKVLNLCLNCQREHFPPHRGGQSKTRLLTPWVTRR